MEKLPGAYITGFVDGEGCFALSFRRDVRHERGKRSGKKPVYFYWKAQFVIVLRNDDKKLIERIKKSLDCGSISFTRNQIRYQVSSLDDLKNKIAPFFFRYGLQSKKREDFILWSKAIEILNKYKIRRNIQRDGVNRKSGERGFYRVKWDQKDLHQLMEVHHKMLIYKSSKTNQAKWINRARYVGRENHD